MHLRSVTLKGFKSFAAPTTFTLEPGVTAIVGPNGSGKSNVVDALAWVMGEQGAKTLRGGKMEDVIFAGTSTRGPLGRAEVALTIDNADGALPIDYSEVTISRTLFRNGASEYAINGDTCRLLDVQELLSDSGLGREMHVIVGQGRLDTVLAASPEDRRGFIEEAAGILKHRRRKDKTLRKLDAMEANLTRLSDLGGELRRQLKPLGRQAEIARAAAGDAAVARDAKARLLADDLVTLRGQLAEHAFEEAERIAERIVLDDDARTLRARIDALEALGRSETVDDARRVAFGLEQVQERIRGLYSLAGQRLSLLHDDDDAPPSTPSVTSETIVAVRAQIDEIRDGLGAAVGTAESAGREVASARAEVNAVDEDIAAQSALVSEHDMRISARRATAQAAASTLDALRAAVGRQRAGLASALARYADAQQARDAAVPDAAGEGASAEHSGVYERAQRDVAESETAVDALRDRLHAAEREADALTAQTRALGRALDVRNAASQLVSSGGSGVRGLVGDAVTVRPGYEAAIAAALGSLSEGVLVETVEDAQVAAATARGDEMGVIDIVIATVGAVYRAPRAVPGVTPAREVMTAPDGIVEALARVVVADDLDAALAAIGSAAAGEIGASLVAVTRSGEVVTAQTLRAGSGGGRSRLELAAERDAATQRLAEIDVVAASLREALADATAHLDGARERLRVSLDELRAYDAALAARTEAVNAVAVRLEAAGAERDRLTVSLDQAERAVDDAAGAARTAEADVQRALETPRPLLDASVRDRLAVALEAARDAEMRVRLDVETLRERVRAGEASAVELEARRDRERAHAIETARRAVVRRAQRDAAAAVVAQLPPLIDAVDRSVSAARVELAHAESDRVALTADLAALRVREAEVRERTSRVTESVHGLELRMHEQRLHVSALVDRAQVELGVDENILLVEYGPDQLIPASSETDEPTHYDRAEQVSRLVRAERSLAQLGRVNPLALEEFAALEQRHAFLTAQLADLTQTRKDLLTIVGELDERMRVIFLDAFEDTRTAFGEVFPILFPGGTGSIALTDSDEPLTSGIEVSVRPAGKKIERLSLLSGGERSLAAVALLTAIFRARPSPFYILDEVEAALDDANLGRLLGVFEQLRENSQLIVITHQKRTMEIADALYGVSMRHDGVSAVVGQRMREAVPA